MSAKTLYPTPATRSLRSFGLDPDLAGDSARGTSVSRRRCAREAGLLPGSVGEDVEVNPAYQDLSTSETRLAELQTQVSAARQALEQAEASYAAGLVTNLERTSAQDQLLSAQLQLAGEYYTRKLLYLRLAQSSGSLRAQLTLAEGQSAPAPTSTQPTTVPARPLKLRRR